MLLRLLTRSGEETQVVGAVLGRLLQAGDILAVVGDLGTGKTCLTQGIGRGMGITRPITSPTFTLINEYYPPPPAPPLFHVDLYRLQDASTEAVDIGLLELLDEAGVCVIEWADRARGLLPPSHLWIELQWQQDETRRIQFTAYGVRYHDLLRQFAAILAASGWDVEMQELEDSPCF
ncbi:MAG TPA: tRNA (adenosine(37)-N6)-threonylcarbamoyltransferase complex ATPase subunit type 1 TsaE [Anaerolineae bacterium]|nr:tRNA (adenosine(37)-N6)-threonylcarbamoyltransferase complex ATPase subunit type 1 TsaE [Anaerolineae bacterium]